MWLLSTRLALLVEVPLLPVLVWVVICVVVVEVKRAFSHEGLGGYVLVPGLLSLLFSSDRVASLWISVVEDVLVVEVVWMLAFVFVVSSLVAEFSSGVPNNVLFANKSGVGASSSAWAEVVAVEFSSGIAGDDFVSGVTVIFSLCFHGVDVTVLTSVVEVEVVGEAASMIELVLWFLEEGLTGRVIFELVGPLSVPEWF